MVGAAIFTRPDSVDAYRKPPNRTLTTAFPCFSIGANGPDTAQAKAFLSRNIKAPDAAFAQRFQKGEFRQDACSILSAARTILESQTEGLVLLDHQRFALARCMALLQDALAQHGAQRKLTLVVKGPPGSGKSVVALKLWAHAVETLSQVAGSKHFVTTSESQADNWERTIDQIHGNADWLSRRASSFQPIKGTEFGPLLQKHRIPSGGRASLISLASRISSSITSTVVRPRFW